jgi:hypothetical protein
VKSNLLLNWGNALSLSIACYWVVVVHTMVI